MDFRKALAVFQTLFEPVLARELAALKAEQEADLDPLGLMDQLINLITRGGKRLRSAILYHAYLGLGGQEEELALRLGVSCELMQGALLVHDDIMDHAAVRRGGETLHKHFTDIHPSRDREFGLAVGILAGNLAGYLGMQLIQDSALESGLKNKVLEYYIKVAIDENFGQALDLRAALGAEPGEEDILQIQRYKTARYTTEYPLQLAGLLAGARQQTIESLGQIGQDLGLVFQIQDDVLGVFGDEVVTGKSVSGDIIEGKHTLLTVKAQAAASSQQQQLLERTLGNAEASEADIREVRQVMRDSGALQYSRDMSRKLVARAKHGLSELGLSLPGADFLTGLADYLIEREV